MCFRTVPVFALWLLTQCVFLSAQFSTGFSSEDGFADGDLINDLRWEGTPNTFLVDNADAGSLTIDSALPFRVARYVGEGGVFSQESYKVTMVFSLNFEEGQSAEVKGGAMAAGFVQFENLSDINEIAGASLRQVSGGGPGVFNLFVINTFDGSNTADFCPRFEASALGLAYDNDGNWTDGSSDPLELVYELSYENGVWSEQASITNLETSVLLGIASLSTSDSGDSFLENEKGFRINTDKIDQNPVTVEIDRLAVEAE